MVFDMLKNREGQPVPNVTFRVRDAAGAWKDLTTADLFGKKRVVVFALPGAFTPTCSSAHVPRYNQLVPDFKKLGIDDVVCLSVNDTFVMSAWQQDQDAGQITFVPDGNGEFSQGMGMLVDKKALGFGGRSWRYSMLVNDGTIEKMFIEEDRPGDPFDVSDADTMLSYLGGKAGPDILLFTKPGCGHCARAKGALHEVHLDFSELPTNPRILGALPGGGTTPQVFIDGAHIGGADELVQWLAKR